MNKNNMSARDCILSKVRSGKPEAVALPDVPLYKTAGDAKANFKSRLESFDGRWHEFGSRAKAVTWLGANIDRGSKKVCSSLPDYKGTLSPCDIIDPHDAHTLDITVAEGILGVGETGSVYVTDRSLGLAAAALLAPDLYLLLDSSEIVDGIHTAYDRIRLRDSQYGSFFTGPSATADIEAIHITGAQGPVSLTVLLY